MTEPTRIRDTVPAAWREAEASALDAMAGVVDRCVADVGELEYLAESRSDGRIAQEARSFAASLRSMRSDLANEASKLRAANGSFR